MLIINSPENYNEMLSKLNRATFYSTLIFFICLRYFEYIPNIEINKSLTPPTNDYKELLEWTLSFGVLPIAAAFTALSLSHSFEMHNILAKLSGIRYIWDKYFIVSVLAKRAGISAKFNRHQVKQIMHSLYYPSIRNIDPHYVNLFWRYALPFWILFEHLVIVAVTTIALKIKNLEQPLTDLYLYLTIITFLCLSQWLLVTTKKSKDQAQQIPLQEIKEYFRTIGYP